MQPNKITNQKSLLHNKHNHNHSPSHNTPPQSNTKNKTTAVAVKTQNMTLSQLIGQKNHNQNLLSSQKTKPKRNYIKKNKSPKNNSKAKKKIDQDRTSQNHQQSHIINTKQEPDLPTPQEPTTTHKIHVPKLIEVNGKMVLDISSLIKKEEVNPLQNSTATSIKSKSSRNGKREHSEKWTPEETLKFYDALQWLGTDFTMIELLFPNRTRKQIKNKYTKEERLNPKKIDSLIRKAATLSMSQFEERHGPIPEEIKSQFALLAEFE